MSSKWFDFDDELSLNRDSFELLKENFGLSTRGAVSQKKLRSCSSTNRINDIFDLDATSVGIFKDKLWDCVTKDRLMGKSKFREHNRISDPEGDELLMDLSESARKIRDRFSREFESEISDRRMRKMYTRDSPGCSSTFSNPDSDHTLGSTKSSCQGKVTFPESSTASVNSDNISEKSFGRSMSVNSEESICTEKSADCSTLCETLPDGTNKTQFENNETWLAKSASGSVCEKKVKDSAVTEKNEDKLCDKTMKKTSYIERSATGTSLQEESTSERVVSCDKTGKKTVEHKTSSETYKKAYCSPKSSSTFLDELDSSSFRDRRSNYRESVDSSKRSVSEKISKFIDEVHQDNFFRMPSNIEENINRMTNDFAEKESLARERRRYGRRKVSDILSEATPVTQMENQCWRNSDPYARIQNMVLNLDDIRLIMDNIRIQWFHDRSPAEEIICLEDAIIKLGHEFRQHKYLLEEMMKSFERDWEVERKEKQKILQEKEDLEKKVQELTTEVTSLKEALADEKRKSNFCGSCKVIRDNATVFPGKTYIPGNASFETPNVDMPTFRNAVHVPSNANDLSAHDHFFSDDYISKKFVSDQRASFIPNAGDSYLSERFSECSIKTSGETIAVENENYVMTTNQQFSSKDKSILKKTDKKKKISATTCEETQVKNSGRSRKSSASDRQTSCEEYESQSVSIGFEKDGRAMVTSFSTYPIPESAGYSHTTTEVLSGETHVKSKPE